MEGKKKVYKCTQEHFKPLTQHPSYLPLATSVVAIRKMWSLILEGDGAVERDVRFIYYKIMGNAGVWNANKSCMKGDVWQQHITWQQAHNLTPLLSLNTTEPKLSSINDSPYKARQSSIDAATKTSIWFEGAWRQAPCNLNWCHF